MYTLEELKNDIFNDLNDKRKPIYINHNHNTTVLMYVVSVSDIKDIINKRLDEYFNQILPGEEEYYD
jgi:hypothetical protein